jgi:hypothetical protein
MLPLSMFGSAQFTRANLTTLIVHAGVGAAAAGELAGLSSLL